MEIDEVGWQEILSSTSQCDNAKLSILDVWQTDLSSEQIIGLKDLTVTGNTRVKNKWQILLRYTE